MEPILTTITPFWDRPETLGRWLRSIQLCPDVGVHHILISPFVFPAWAIQRIQSWGRVEVLVTDDPAPLSIGHYHNLGAKMAESEWIMKMDVDCLAHTQFFNGLVEVLQTAKSREWFNVGMHWMEKAGSANELREDCLPITLNGFRNKVDRFARAGGAGGSNFVCRRDDYLRLGGSVYGFRGWGWEDYQQVYMLEKYFLGRDPLPGDVTINNVTVRCRNEITKRRISDLLDRNEDLALMHVWHPDSKDTAYKSEEGVATNRQVLLDYVLKQKAQP